MTVKELLKSGADRLEKCGVENGCNEARWLLEVVLNSDSSYIFLHQNETVPDNIAAEYLNKISERAEGEPLQYILGSWDFYGKTFSVGRGVLIPRPETELLVDYALETLKNQESPVVVDLCAGSGCVGLSVASLLPNSRVFLIEKSPDAFCYLQTNKEKLGCDNAVLVLGDIFSGYAEFDIPKPDIILSNPPYIETKDISLLQKEVLAEPAMALDGGKDGLDFYHAISEKWLSVCKCSIAVECGEDQAQKIKQIFEKYSAKTEVKKDFNNIERVVCAVLNDNG